MEKSDNIGNETGSTFVNLTGSTNIAEINERFDDTKTDNILPGDNALSYLSKKVDDCIDAISNNDGKKGITTKQEGYIIINNEKVSQGLTTKFHTLSFDVVNVEGAYSLVISVIDSSVKPSVKKTASIKLG